MASEGFDWAIVELMGHVRIAGKLSEEERFGVKMGRLDIPDSRPCEACAGTGQSSFMDAAPCAACGGRKAKEFFVTQYFGGASVYRITLVSEQVARHVASQNKPAPVSAWDFPKQLPHMPITEDRVMSCGHTPEDCDCDSDDDGDCPY